MLELDNLLVYNGSIPKFNDTSSRASGECLKRKPCQSIVFSNNSKLLFSEKHDVSIICAMYFVIN